MKLSTPFPEFNDYIRPLCVPFGGIYPAESIQRNDEGIPVSLAGFGILEYNTTNKVSKIY